MPRGSDTLAAARREEILDACAQLYEQKPFREITLGEIGEKTSFTRTSIYNYFRTKEEIFLALLEREYRIWIAGLEELTKACPLSAAAFSKRFAAALEERRREIGRRTAGMGGRALAGGDPRENRGSAGAAESAGVESGAGGADQKRFGGVEGED